MRFIPDLLDFQRLFRQALDQIQTVWAVSMCVVLLPTITQKPMMQTFGMSRSQLIEGISIK